MNILSKITKSLSGHSLRGLFTSNSWSSPSFNDKDSLDIYKLSLYLHKAIEKRARSVSKIEFELYNKQGEEIKESKWLDLLRKPNDKFAGTEFWRLFQIYKDLAGEVFIYKEKTGKDVDAIHLINPLNVRMEFDKNGEGNVEKYIVQLPKGQTTTYEPEDVIRIYTPNPDNQMKAMSLIEGGEKSLHTEIQLRDYQEHVLQNGGRVEGIFKFNTESGLSKENLDRLKKQYQQQYTGAKKSGGPLFLGGDANYEQLGLSPKELAFVDSLKMTLEDICILTEVPKAILSSFADIKYKNAEEAHKIYLRETVKSLLDDLVNNLNEFLIPDDLILKYKGVVPQDKEDLRKDLKTAHEINAITINEKREKLGLEPIKNGDQILAPMNLMPIGESEEVEDKE